MRVSGSSFYTSCGRLTVGMFRFILRRGRKKLLRRFSPYGLARLHY